MSAAGGRRPTRVVVVYWPDWSVVAAGGRPDQPAAVVTANRVVALTPAARAEGVRTGLRRREAQGRCPNLEVLPADPGRDARAWEPVVAAVEQLTPSVEILAPGALCFGARAASRYFGGDAALAARVRAVATAAAGPDQIDAGDAAAAAAAAQPGCRVGVADGRFAAGLAARAIASAPGLGPDFLVIPPGGSRAWLAPQPVQALGPSMADLSDLLVRLGIRTLGGLAALPAATVLGRFATEGETARRLALGLDDRPVQARLPSPDLACAAEMDPPEERVEAAAFVAKSLADQLHERLGSAGLVTTMVAIEVETEHGEKLVRHWRHEGALNAQALAERTRWQLDGWLSGTSGRSPTGGLTLLRLTPLEVRPDDGRQLGLWGGMADVDARAARAMARVQGLLGPEAVVTAVRGGGRGHAEQIRLVPWGDARDQAGWPGPAATYAASRAAHPAGGPGRPAIPASSVPPAAGRAPGSSVPPAAGRAPASSVPPATGRALASRGSAGVAATRARRRPSGAAEPARTVEPWPGRLPPPAPPLVHGPALTADVCDADGRSVEVSGRGAVSAPPAALAIGGGPLVAITGWAGPWPVEERWWEQGGRRRARFQVMLETGEAHLVCREASSWWVEASYS